jgi:eukaryotic translation initiation factor 2C
MASSTGSVLPYFRNIAAPGTDDEQYSLPTEFTKRPGFNNTGKAVQLHVNAYPVVQYPTAKVYQYDVVIGSGAEKRIVQRKVWESKQRKAKTGSAMIWDGSRLAWSLKDHEEMRLMVDLDEEEGRPSRPGGKNVFRLHIRKTRPVDISIIQQYLEGQVQFSIQVAEAINFIDHLLREGPSSSPQFLTVRRSVFKRAGERCDLGSGVEAWRGIYQSARLAQGGKLVINLDVSNTCFWKSAALISTIITKWKLRDPSQIVNLLKPKGENGSRKASYDHQVMERSLKGVEVKAQYRGNPMPEKEWKIFKISLNNALEETLEWKDPTTKQPTGERVTIAQYFKRKYNTALQYPNLPLIEMTKRGVLYPMEFLQIVSGQRYNSKLDEMQTAAMIKFAVSPPNVRLRAINEGRSWLNWGSDTYLTNYGMRISQEPVKTNARILPPPGIKFGNKIEPASTRGRWDLRGKTFLAKNPQELVSWGVGVFPGRLNVDRAAVDRFILDFSRAYRTHGGTVANRPPCVVQLNADAGVAVEALYLATGNMFNKAPQLMIFLVQDRGAFHYLRIKKSADCRYGVLSQVMQISQVLKGNPQYYSNVLMKVNAKLGGTTSQAVPSPASGFKSFTAPTMIIGADVSHASPGSIQPSMAALTMSFDRFGGRYAAGCQTNGHRVEMISEANMKSLLTPLARRWMNDVGGGRIPQHIYYIRDGVSEGQYAHVLNQEVPHIKAVMNACNNNQVWEGKLTVVIASKRHHIRAFPISRDAQDQKGNPLPGCLIERDVTTPNEFDFYLYSHIALQGTSRPVHYTVIYDSANSKPELLQNMIYEHCYQYMRSTTSVSLHPAVYYAHLASNRAKSHEDISASAGPQAGPGFKQNINQSRGSEPSESEVKPLIAMENKFGIIFSMWYI